MESDSNFAACIIPEPSSFKLCCAHAGALTFRGVVPGVSAHAAMRLEGISAMVALCFPARDRGVTRRVGQRSSAR